MCHFHLDLQEAVDSLIHTKRPGGLGGVWQAPGRWSCLWGRWSTSIIGQIIDFSQGSLCDVVDGFFSSDDFIPFILCCHRCMEKAS